jgi:CRISPR-associated protein Csx17
MKQIILSGCAPVPLAHYLKALGILRLVTEQADNSARAVWHHDQFLLESRLDREALLEFFLRDYTPTPVIAPWNGGSGFHPKDNSAALNAIQGAASPRFERYKAVVAAAQAALQSMSLGEKPTPEQKANLLLLCRNMLPESALQWLDAAYVLTDNGAKYPPLLGTGGNDGRLEFTNNFMQRLLEVMNPTSGEAVEGSAERLAAAIFADPVPTPLAKAPVGQFLPGSAGGANATSGFDAASAVNPWDFILMIEGALIFAAASVKRLESGETGALVYPFCVRQAGVGYASASAVDESAARAEMWLPVWTRRPATLAEISAVFSEGRAQVGGKPARNGVDFARAVVGLGVDRGLDEFQRYGFQVRNGLSYFATPLTRVTAKRNASIDLLSDVDSWLDRFRRAATKDTAPASVARALRTLESAIVDLCVHETSERHLAVFLALGQCQKAVAKSLKWAGESFLQPLQGLRKGWLRADHWNDTRHGTEFRLAAALASLNGKFEKNWLPFRCHLEAVDSFRRNDILSYRWSDLASNNVQWSEGSLIRVLNHIFARRLILHEEPLQKRRECWARLPDIKAFIEGSIDDDLLSDLLWSMSLINWAEATPLPINQPERLLPPTLFALLKLCFPPARQMLPEPLLEVPAVPEIHRWAANGDGERAAAMALRRLRGSGYHPVLKSLSVKGDYARRTAAALLFPMFDRDMERLHNQITRPEQETETTANEPVTLNH